MDTNEMRQKLIEKMKNENHPPCPEATRCINGRPLFDLRTKVGIRFSNAGCQDHDISDQAILEYSNVLCNKWHGVGTMADRVFTNWVNRHPLATGNAGDQGQGQQRSSSRR
jgi:hypothetical protein